MASLPKIGSLPLLLFLYRVPSGPGPTLGAGSQITLVCLGLSRARGDGAVLSRILWTNGGLRSFLRCCLRSLQKTP